MFDWQAVDGGFQAKMPWDVTLVVTPDRYAKGFTPKAARGTKWHSQASHWCERTRTMSRYGRDEYGNLQDTVEAAKRLAEDIYQGVGR